ncbi:MAG: hypothetical protein Fur0020_12270 [Thermodesulfovibrionia bacterium]
MLSPSGTFLSGSRKKKSIKIVNNNGNKANDGLAKIDTMIVRKRNARIKG